MLWLVAIWAIMAGIVFIVASFFVRKVGNDDRRADPALTCSTRRCCRPVAALRSSVVPAPTGERHDIRNASRRPGPHRLVLIEYQNDFTTEGGTLHGAVAP